jgi:hypothetical protein
MASKLYRMIVSFLKMGAMIVILYLGETQYVCARSISDLGDICYNISSHNAVQKGPSKHVHSARTAKAYVTLKVKNALVMSVRCITECTARNPSRVWLVLIS